MVQIADNYPSYIYKLSVIIYFIWISI